MTEMVQRLQAVHEAIADAARKAGRDEKEIALLCVSKNFGPEAVLEAASLGETAFGENRVDEFLTKHDNIDLSVQWHLIGQLQTNKVKKIIGKTTLIQSLDRPSLAEELSRRSAAAGVVTDVLLQVDLQKREGRGGATGEDAKALLDKVLSLPGLRVRGLMNVAPLGVSPRETNENFAQVKALFDHLSREVRSADFSILSMGMSGDFELAIAQGSTMVRIGSAIFGARN
jgi:pyridoxal phosphate enzyme (YggS family)